MKVWRFDDDASNFKRLRFVDNIDGREFIRSFDGSSKLKSWVSPKLEFEPEDINKPIGDFIHLLSGFFVVNKRVANLFEKHFASSIELLPLDFAEEFYIVNILDTDKYIDYEKSSIKYFPNSEQILRIKKFEFIEAILQDKLIFKDDGFPVTEIYVTDEAKRLVEDWEVKGFRFVELWASDL